MSSLTELLNARRELELVRKRNALVENFGLLGYEPHDKQDRFHRRAGVKRRYVRTGNRFGKSTAGVAETCAFALGYRPWYLRDFDVKDHHGKVVREHRVPRDEWMAYEGIPQKSNSILILVTDWDKANEIFTNEVQGQKQGKLFKMLPVGSYTTKRNHTGNISEVSVKSKWGGESVICLDTVQSFKSNPMGQESSDWDAIHVDEPIPNEMWVANARGLVDRNGSAWFTCTPLTEMWINDMFEPEGTKVRSVGGELLTTKAVDGGDGCKYEVSFWMITGSMHDNPHFEGVAKAQFISELTEDQKAARVEGKPSALQGAIYKTFVREHFTQGGHLFEAKDTRRLGWVSPTNPPPDYAVRVAIDTHPSTPHAVLFCATSPTGHTYFYTEIFEQIHPRNLAWRVLRRLDDVSEEDDTEYMSARMPMRVLLEQAAYNKTPFDGLTIADEMIQAGLPSVEPAKKDLSYGILRVNQELQRRDDKGCPYLLFSEDLYETLREFGRYVWDPKTGKPVDRDDHMMENLYRLVLTGLTYVDPMRFEVSEMRSAVPKPAAAMDLTLPWEHEGRKKDSRKARYRSGTLAGLSVRRVLNNREALLYRGSYE